MLLPPCRLAVFDRTDNALLLLNTASGAVLFRRPLPHTYRPLALVSSEKGVLFFANGKTDGSVYTLRKGTWARQPVTLPTMTAVCPVQNENACYLASARHTLYRLDLDSGKLSSLGSSPHICRALVHGTYLASVWETAGGTVCALHKKDGTILSEHRLDGTVPSATITGTTLLCPFTNGKQCGEGLHLIATDAPSPSVTTISLKSPQMRGITADPYSVLALGDTLCLVSEATGTVTKIDRHTGDITGSYSLGRSISHLYLLPDERFAIATSNMFADLSLVDLVNEKLLSISICAHELFHQIAILPPT